MFKFIPIALFALAGCAEVTATRVTVENPSPDGLPAYGHKPILIIGPSGAKVETIPNLNERYAVRLRAFFAKNDAEVDFSDRGFIKLVKANLDSTDALAILEKIVDKVPTGVTASDGLPELASAGSGISVYDFVFNADGTLSLKLLTQDGVSLASGSAASGETTSGSFSPIE